MRFQIYGFVGIAFLIVFSVYFHGTTKRFTEQLWFMTNSCNSTVHSSATFFASPKHVSRSEKVPREEQRIVFMAGPHKTGSTSIQVNLATWSVKGLLGQWRWGISSTECVFKNISQLRQGRNPEKRKIELKYGKGYSPLMNLLAKTGQSYPEEEEDQLALMSCYRNQLKALWKDGYNIVLGSEAADFGLRSKVDANTFIRGILDIMPTVSKKDGSIVERITFVITYRSPRVDHYISYWHMAGNPPTLREWTLQTPYELHPLNPLGLAKLYLDFGFKVVILDSSGLQKELIDLSNGVACNILKVPCENDQIIGNNVPPQIRNPGDDNDMNDLTALELLSIDEALRIHDCNYRNLLFHSNLTIKYGFKLVQSLTNCSTDHQFIPWSSLVSQIKDIARSGNLEQTRL